MLNEEVARYRELSGDTTPNVPISRIGGYLDGYEKALEQEPKLEPCWETCFDCPLSHGCPKIKGCTNEQAIEYASKIPNDCPLSAQPKTGHWIKYGIPRCGEQHYKCTSCGYYINFGQWGELYTKEFKYCPNCGTKMIEPQEESED